MDPSHDLTAPIDDPQKLPDGDAKSLERRVPTQGDRMTESRVVVVGGGIVGAMVADALTPSHEVILLERDELAAGATGLSAGLVAPTLFYGDLPTVARYANEAIRSFAGTGDFEFTERPRIDVVTEGEVSDARQTASRLAADGFPVTYLDRDAVEKRFPLVDLSDFTGALCYEDTGWVDPYTYAMELLRSAQNRGARVHIGVEVTAVREEGGSVRQVETTDGCLDTDAVVLAAGWQTPAVLPGSCTVPVVPYRTQCLVLEPDRPLDTHVPLGRVSSEDLYFRPEHNGDLLVGGSAHRCTDPTRESTQPDETFTHAVADVVPRLLEGFADAGVVNGWAGFDAATPDARPIIGPLRDGPDGLLVATGFNGLGVMVGAIAGPIVREALGGPAAPFQTGPFSPDRFDGNDTSFELRSTSDV